jgi:hypothetical protein
MPKIATARWPGVCSKCKGKISYGDTIVTYTGEKRGPSKRAHHHYPGCAPFTGEIVYVDIESTDLLDIKHRLRSLKQINTDWAVDEIVKITKMDISSSWDEGPVEFDAFMHILLDREEQIGTGGILAIVNQILIEAKRVDIQIEARHILSDWSR